MVASSMSSGWQGMAMTKRAAVPSLLDNLPVWVSSESTCSGRGCDRRSGHFPTFQDRKRASLGIKPFPPKVASEKQGVICQ